MSDPSFAVQAKYKSDIKANEFREKGNQAFQKRKYFDAILLFNKSIAFSNSKKVLSFGYANRSAVYAEIGRYEEALKNIEWARENEYPLDKIEKLNQREEKCKKLIEETPKIDENYSDFFKLSYPSNEKIPWVVDCVEVRYTKKYGRGVYAKQDLKPGDIICIEKPFVHFFIDYQPDEHYDSSYTRCENCYKICMMNLIPCERIASFMFCSTECRDSLYSKPMDMVKYMSDDVRILTEMMILAGGKDNLHKFLNRTNVKKLTKTIFDYDFSDPSDPKYNENILSCYLSLTSKCKVLIGKSYWQNGELVSDEIEQRIINSIMVNRLANIIYGNIVFNHMRDGVVLTLFSSLMNHSCIANANPTFFDDKVVTYIKRPVKAGEQIFFNYVNEFDFQCDITMTELSMEFKCDCKACTGEIILPDQNSIIHKIAIMKWATKLAFKDPNEGVLIFKKICEEMESASSENLQWLVLGCTLLMNRITARSVYPCINNI